MNPIPEIPDAAVQAAAEEMRRQYDGDYAPYATWHDFADKARRILAAALSTDTRHIIDLRDDGWTIQHPLACRPNLFDCPVNRVATRVVKRAPAQPGRYYCELGERGGLVIGEPVP